MKNFKFAFIVVFTFINHLIFGQSIEVLHGFEMYYSKFESGSPNYATKYINNADPFWKIRIGLTPFPNKKLYTSIGYHTNRSWADLRIGTKEEYLNADGIQGGSSNTTLHRITLGFGYRFKFWSNRIKIRPSINLNFEKHIGHGQMGLDKPIPMNHIL